MSETSRLVSDRDLYWHCRCGNHEVAEPPYEHGDAEPCIHCPSTSFVVTLKEGAAAEQAACFGGRDACHQKLLGFASAAFDARQSTPTPNDRS